MLRVLGSATRTCAGVRRRELLRAGGLGLLAGLSGAADAAPRRPARARAIIVVNLLGGPSHLDMFDMKPDAPAEIRGEFRPIESSLSGLQVCEHLPRIARTMHRSTLIRTYSHTFNSHDPYPVLTGSTRGNPSAQADPADDPSIGAVCQHLGLGRSDVPVHACLPCYPGWGQTWVRKGPYGGWLGKRYDPLFAVCRPTFDRSPKRPYYDAVKVMGEPRLEGLDHLPGMTLDRLDRRRDLLTQIDREARRVEESPLLGQAADAQRRAFALLTSPTVRQAFDLKREPEARRHRYGDHLWGQSLLTARRLVEAGVVFVTVTYEVFETGGKQGNGIAFDTHEENFDALRRILLPSLDEGYTALIEDLGDRGLLDDTVVLVMGEMGRSPRINARAGRDHWPQCGSALLTGGGIRQGHVHGRSDATGAYPVEYPVSPGDLAATLYDLLGIDPDQAILDPQARPIPISHGGTPVPIVSGAS